MKLLKKVLAGALSLAVICGAMFAFTGCNSVKNKTYAVEDMTMTVVKAVDADGKVTETQTLSMRETYMMTELGKSLEDIATYVMTAEEEAEYAKYVEEGKANAPRIMFTKNEVHMIEDEKSEISGKVERRVSIAEYTVEKNKITVIEKHSENDMKNLIEYEINTVEIVDGKLHQVKYFNEDPEYVWTVGMPYYATTIFAEVK